MTGSGPKKVASAGKLIGAIRPTADRGGTEVIAAKRSVAVPVPHQIV
jgi:hypothetical protein